MMNKKNYQLVLIPTKFCFSGLIVIHVMRVFMLAFGIDNQTVAYVMRLLKFLNCEWQFGTNTNKVCLSGLVAIHVMRVFMLVFGVDNQIVAYVMRLLMVLNGEWQFGTNTNKLL